MLWLSNRLNGWVPAEPSQQALRLDRLDRVPAHPAQLLAGVRRVAADRRVELDQRLEQLGRDLLGELAAGLGLQDLLGARDEVQRLGVEEHVLLLDPDGERRPGPEMVVADVGRRRDPRHQPPSAACAAATRAIGSR